MKLLNFICIATFAVVFPCILHAKIWRVNNNPGVTADFSNAQAAINAAEPGDTIHIEPSNTNYGNIDVNKQLVLISTGSFGVENPGIQTDPKHGFVGNINIQNTAANGSVISLAFSDGIRIEKGVSNITLLSCVGRGFGSLDNANCCGRPHIHITNSDNIVISKCLVSSIRFDGGSNNIVVTNNIVLGFIANDAGSDGIVSNNVIRAGNGNEGVSLNNCVVANNIYNVSLNTSFNNCNVSNNMAPGTGTPPIGFSFADMATVFVNNAGGFVDNPWQLKTGSPAIAAGEGGVDLGAFGGANPFRLGVTPPIPSVYKLQVPASPAGNSMNIIFSTRSNN